MTGHSRCGCGCGAVIYPGSYAHRIGDRYYQQMCVNLVVVPHNAPGEQVHSSPEPAEIKSR